MCDIHLASTKELFTHCLRIICSLKRVVKLVNIMSRMLDVLLGGLIISEPSASRSSLVYFDDLISYSDRM
jgi:hypothetical protein